jgi:hypothetical protein
MSLCIPSTPLLLSNPAPEKWAGYDGEAVARDSCWLWAPVVGVRVLESAEDSVADRERLGGGSERLWPLRELEPGAGVVMPVGRVGVGVAGVTGLVGRWEGVTAWKTEGAREVVGVFLGASASKIPDSFRTLRPAARSLVNRSCTAFAVGFSLNQFAIAWYSTPEIPRPKPNRRRERSFSAVHFIFLDFGRPPSGL